MLVYNISNSGVKSGNKEFASAVAGWTFQESLALRIDSVSHHRVNQSEALEAYTTNDEIVCLFYDIIFGFSD